MKPRGNIAGAELGAAWFTRLSRVAPANDDGTGAAPMRRALVHAGPPVTPRERFAVALHSAATRACAGGDARASIALEAAALLGRDTGRDPQHTSRVMFVAASEAAALARRAGLDAAGATLAHRGAVDVLRGALEALTAAVVALDAATVGGAP